MADPGVATTMAANDLAARLRAAVPVFADVTHLRRLTGGSSHETWAFDARVEGEAAAQPLILRREFGQALFDMGLETEFQLMNRLHAMGVAVPRPLLHAEAGTALGPPFMVVERVAGVDMRKAMATGGQAADRSRLGGELVAALADLHGRPAAAVRDLLPGDGRDAPQRELAKWSPIIARGGDRSPAARVAVEWLRNNGFTVDRPAIVHGDYKANNILLRAGGGPVIIDWELAHLGDPLEDLAWTMLWTSRDDLVGGMVSPEAFLADYERSSGTVVDRRRLFFWELLALVKLVAIFLKGLERPGDAAAPRPTLMMLGQGVPCLEAAIADRLSRTLEARAAA